tara:strand:- start:124 stop:528 length:405 start_codon:yes stop_codon:yes gene_type:complete
MKKRVLKEIKLSPVTFWDRDKDIFEIHLQCNKHLVIIYLDIQSYPFHPPRRIKLDNVNYLSFLARPIFKTISPRCLCCQSLLCPDNWGPVKTMNDILNEVKQNLKLLLRIQQRLCATVIARKYLFEDCPIQQYI